MKHAVLHGNSYRKSLDMLNPIYIRSSRCGTSGESARTGRE